MGAEVQRDSRIRKPPQRPKEGWNLLVQPLTGRNGKVRAPAPPHLRQDLKPHV